MKDELIYTVSFAAKELSMKVEKAKLKCEIQMTEILLKRLRRELNKLLKEIRSQKIKLPYTAFSDSTGEANDSRSSEVSGSAPSND